MPDMRFAPPKRLRIADRAGGLNQVSVGSYNERLILSLLLQQSGMSRLEIGRTTGLSAQTVSVIVRSLVHEGLIVKGKAKRGRVGPPTVPLSLHPEGAFSVGVSIGFRQVDIVLINFIGTVLFQASVHYDKRKQSVTLMRCIEAVEKALAALPKRSRKRVAGIGLAVHESTDAGEISASKTVVQLDNLYSELENLFGFTVYAHNDISAAVSGESMFGVLRKESDYLYFLLGATLRSRLVLNHQIHKGNEAFEPAGLNVGLLNVEKHLIERGYDTQMLWTSSSDWSEYDQELVSVWREECRETMKRSIQSLAQFVDFKTVVLSGSGSGAIYNSICEGLDNELSGIKATTGDIKDVPVAIGAASLPYVSRFMI